MDFWIYAVVFLSLYFLAKLGILFFRVASEQIGNSYVAKEKGSQGLKGLIAIRPDQVLGVSLVSGLILGGIVWWVFNGKMLGSVAFLCAVCFPPVVINYLKAKRLETFEEQFPDALTLLANSLRSGISLPNAMARVAAEMGPPVSTEFQMLSSELNFGKEKDAFVNFINRVDVESVRLFAISIITCSSKGVNFAEMADKIGETIRKNIELKRELRTMTAEGKLQGMLMGSMPAVMCGMLYVVQPEFIEPLFTTLAGHLIILTVFLMELFGFFAVRWILNIEED